MNELNYFSLDNYVKIYIPSTIDIDKGIDNSQYVQKTLTKLSRWFGGSTAYSAKGAWLSKQKGLVIEDVTICQSFATAKSLSITLNKVDNYCKYLKRTLRQEAISLEVNNKLYFI